MKSWEEYVNTAPNVKRTHYWDLKPSIRVGLSSLAEGPPSTTTTMSIKRLLSLGAKREIEDSIQYIALRRYGQKSRKLGIKLPLDLDNLDYVRGYAVMISEGSFRNEFRLHVPEEVFHRILSSSLGNLLGRQLLRFMHKATQKKVPRTSFPLCVGYLLPIPDHMPRFILRKKELCREHLRIAFEAEGSAIISKSKRYIRLVRSTDVSDIVGELDLSVGQRLTFGRLKQTCPILAKIVLGHPPSTLLGEHLILLHHFRIMNRIAPESIRRNKTTFRRGEFSAKWALHIYSEDLAKFGREIGFLSKSKNSKIRKMLKVQGRRRKLSSFNEVIKHLQKDGIFRAKDFSTKMRQIGYKSPLAYLTRYKKNGLIELIQPGVYRIKAKS